MSGTKSASYEKRRLLAPTYRAQRGLDASREVSFGNPAAVLGEKGNVMVVETGIDQLEVRQKASRLMP